VLALAIGDLMAGLLPADDSFTGVLPADELLLEGLSEPRPDTHNVASIASSSILLNDDSPVPLDVDARYLPNHVYCAQCTVMHVQQQRVKSNKRGTSHDFIPKQYMQEQISVRQQRSLCKLSTSWPVRWC
jgi:hypothetical protein